MTDRIPKLSAWCSYCLAPEAYGNPPGPCGHHRGADGQPVEYTGRDAYEPSAWVLDVVGKRYRSYRGVCECFGYDPRQGFWMRAVATGESRNVAEHAIERTYYRIKLTWGAREMLLRISELGHIPTPEQAPMVAIPLARQTLEDLGLVDAAGNITDAGREEIARMCEETAT